jgi:catechol 2,3-dioxygenase-like lactoylglutathione lyase family enzyme
MTAIASEGSTAKAVSLNHIAIMVPEMEPGVAWYQEKFGASVLDRWDNPETGMEWAHLSIGDFVLELVQMPNFNPAPGRTYGLHHIGLTVDDCDAFVGKLKAAGVEVWREPSDFERHAIRWAFVKDYLGNVLEIISPLERAKA